MANHLKQHHWKTLMEIGKPVGIRVSSYAFRTARSNLTDLDVGFQERGLLPLGCGAFKLGN